ncbi:MAG TPA: hypothetical protein VHW65_11630 [Gemmatimonadales bacterium]|jgi:Spy/CpxP family protein refolding chaperone|nr:hypothetical protein [Gemmatimonadales bacterium]
MKARFALLAMIVMAAAPLSAQGNGGGRRGGGGRGGMTNVDMMATALSLTADQKASYQKVVDAYNAQAMPLNTYVRSQTTAGATVPADSTKKQTDMRAKLTTDLMAIMTTDAQKHMLDSLSKVQPQRRGGGGGGK